MRSPKGDVSSRRIPVVRATALGAVLALAEVYREGLKGLDSRVDYWSNYWSEPDVQIALSTRAFVVGGAAAGGVLGLGAATAQRVLPVPRGVGGAIFGIGVWASVEIAGRQLRGHWHDWTPAYRLRFASGWATFGAVVAGLA